MKKNKFKNIEEKPDGTRTWAKQPLWMHSVEKPVNHNEIRDVVLSFILLAVMAVLAILAVTVLEG